MVPPLLHHCYTAAGSTGLLFLFSPFIYIPAAQSQLHNHHTRNTLMCRRTICTTLVWNNWQCPSAVPPSWRNCACRINVNKRKLKCVRWNQMNSDQFHLVSSNPIVLIRYMGGWQKIKRVQSRSVPPILKTRPSPISCSSSSSWSNVEEPVVCVLLLTLVLRARNSSAPHLR